MLDNSGFNCKEVICSYFTAALEYGYENYNHFTESDKKYVLLCDCGYLCLSTTLVEYTKKGMKIIDKLFNDKVGGKYIDDALMVYIRKRIKDELEIDIEKNPRHKIKTKKEIISTKEKLSATGADEV